MKKKKLIQCYTNHQILKFNVYIPEMQGNEREREREKKKRETAL